MKWCILAFVGFVALAAGLITVSVLYADADEAKYRVNCTVVEVKSNQCYLVRPVSGDITFPYAYNQTPEYVGDKKSCGLVGQLVTCYLYRGTKDCDPDNGVPCTVFTSVTTNESKARMSDYEVLFGLIIGFSVFILCYVIFVCMCYGHNKGKQVKNHYDEL